MEEDVSEATSFSDIDINASHSEFGKYLDTICPYYLMYGMSWEEFWYGSIDQFSHYWQKHQFETEKRNQELWLQGLYIEQAVAAVLDSKHKTRYPEKPYRITEMTEAEREADNKRKVEQMREQLLGIKRRWDAKHNGVESK